MRRIFKYLLEITDLQKVKIPGIVRVLSVDVQNGHVYLWALVDPDEPEVEYSIRIIGTGHPIKSEDIRGKAFYGTVQQGRFVWHIWGDAPRVS